MLKKSLLLTSCLMVGMAFSSVSYAMNNSKENEGHGKSVSRKAKKPKGNGLPADSKQRSLLEWANPYRLWRLQMNAAGEAYEKENRRAYAIKKAQERENDANI